MGVKHDALLGPETPRWLRHPATVDPPNSVKEFIERSNAFFEACVDRAERPTITGYALAVGLPGPTSLMRLGQRMPELRYPISRCLAAISYGYETLMTMGGNSSGAQFMLKNIPDFDPDEPEGSPPVQFFNDRKEVLLETEVHGAAGPEGDSELRDADPVEAYVRLLKRTAGPYRRDENTATRNLNQDKSYKRPILRIIENSASEALADDEEPEVVDEPEPGTL
jgi:hypothetical protein